MPHALLQKCIIVLTISVSIIAVAEEADFRDHAFRGKRAVGKPGFFKTLFSVIGEQYSDTKDTFSKVNGMINDNFLPEHAPVTEATTSSSDPNVTTTAAPYKITRSELNRIIRRNLKGLMRLFNIELQDALKESKITNAEYKKDLNREVSKFL
ncbi:uncharacterized protein [Euwallacea fornicatus]|uniref:uncharacterized protein n=1 Tax=Euwallacea fornicatus TaxID=995702 RepID=UPI00338D8CD9